MISLSYSRGADFFSSKITRVDIKPPQWRLSGRGTFFAGSCFADYLFGEFSSAGLRAAASPFGNIYNPASLAEAAAMLSGSEPAVQPGDCFESGGGYRHFMFHSLKNADSAEALAKQLNSEIESARAFTKTAEAAVITLGTAYVFRRNSAPGGEIVNNCHKLPARGFTRSRLSTAEAAQSLTRCIDHLRSINPELKIILTLSPVRHLRDNAAENSLSKAVLRCAIDEVCAGQEDYIWYYPSYEIMLDELRDYRWYAGDLCHPSDEAVSYIISRFASSIYDKKFLDFLDAWLPVQKDLNHKPFNPDSTGYRDFLEKAQRRKTELLQEYPEFFI